MSSHRIQSGFTLIETLIAMTIIALIMSMVYGSYAATTQSLERYDSQTACRERADLVLRLMVRQLRCAYTPNSDPNSEKQERQKQQAAGPSLPVIQPPLVFRASGRNPYGEFLTFVTTAGPAAGMDRPQTLSFVSYRYDPTQATLSIRQYPCVGQPRDSSETAWIEVLDHVVDIAMEFHDGRQWQPSWSDRPPKRLPQAVRIALTLVDDQGRQHEAETSVPVIGANAAPMGQSTVGRS
jgi:type II secretion system protein J